MLNDNSHSHLPPYIIVTHTGLSEESSFLDIGSGTGKPNVHIAQKFGVKHSVGIEIEKIRYLLSQNNHKVLLQQTLEEGTSINVRNCFFLHGDILQATHLNPFSHIYMFDVGFPTETLHELAIIFNNSISQYLISYNSGLDSVGFNVELIHSLPTFMHGSGERHTCYFYKRTVLDSNIEVDTEPDTVFKEALRVINSGENETLRFVTNKIQEWHDRPKTRSGRGKEMRHRE